MVYFCKVCNKKVRRLNPMMSRPAIIINIFLLTLLTNKAVKGEAMIPKHSLLHCWI